MVLQIDAAQGDAKPDKLAEQQTKLAKNVQLDEENAGLPSKSFLTA